MNIKIRNHVNVYGKGETAMIFAHGFGCAQTMWRYVYPAFTEDYKVVLFDHVGSGNSDLSAYHARKYSTLHGYALDVNEIIEDLGVKNCIFVGHSVSSMIGVLASSKRPDLISKLILIGPSPCYINQEDYVGGFVKADIEQLLDSLDGNYMGWSASMAPVIMGNQDRPELGEELKSSFCRTDPQIAKQFARVTFLSDNREDILSCSTPSLILQCAEDAIAPEVVGKYVASNLKNSELVLMKATGHCPNLSAPEETTAAMKAYLQRVL